MKYKIVYDSPGRIRLRCGFGAFERDCEDSLTSLLTGISGVTSANVSYENGGMLIYYTGDAREEILDAVSSLKASELTPQPPDSMQSIDDEFKKDFFGILRQRILLKLFLPPALRLPLTVWRAVPFVKKGIACLGKGRLGVDVLDAASVSAAILSGNISTASSVMTLLNISALLEGYTRKKAKNALSESLALNIDKVWLVSGDAAELTPASKVNIGDTVRVQSGIMIPFDGVVKDGSAGVNEASLTGEALPQLKTCGMSVFAGTVIEEGSIDIEVLKLQSDSRIHSLIELIENSEDLKSSAQTKAESLADRLVPLSFISSAALYLLSGNLSKALSVLMVDYSCAIKLSTPICVISAMKEAAGKDIMIKGGKFLESYATADTAMFDKTGTLTTSCPHLAKICAFECYGEDEILKISACLEEHFPHSVAKAIVHAAETRGIRHREEHAEVQYIVAHGIASILNGKRALIGSAHFVFDDEKTEFSEEQKHIAEELSEKYSLVYLAVGGKLCGILCIEDPIRPDARDALAALYERGIKNIIMLTGDGESTAANVCRRLGIKEYHAKVLPEDKLRLVNDAKAKGGKVIMIGDGINDSPALAAADVSVAMKDSSDIAREVADITLLVSDLSRLALLRDLSVELFKKIHANYRFITVFNSALLILGVCGILPPVTSALLHNASTMAICANSMRPLLKP